MLGHLGRFLQVGAIGFAIDAGLLWVLIYQLDVALILARVLSFLVTIAVTFGLNASYTFAVPQRDASKLRYGLIQVGGAVINLASYSWLVLYSPLREYPMAALVIGSILASTHNFLMMRRFVFHQAVGRL